MRYVELGQRRYGSKKRIKHGIAKHSKEEDHKSPPAYSFSSIFTKKLIPMIFCSSGVTQKGILYSS